MKRTRTSPSEENYVETIYRLSEKGPVRPGELARVLGVSRPSVTKAIASLASKGFVRHEPYDEIALTERGVALGKAVVRRNDCLRDLLVHVLGMSEESAEREVHRLEHVLSDEVLARLEALVEFACSSDAWLRRLHHRIDNALRQPTEASPFLVGDSDIHQGTPGDNGIVEIFEEIPDNH